MEKLLLWGTGQIAKEVLTQCRTLNMYNILGVIDNNSEREGSNFYGYRVYQPDIVKELQPDKIVILTDAFKEIQKQVLEYYPEFFSRIENKNFFYKESIIKKYETCKEPEVKEVIDYIKLKGLHIFNYPFIEKYEELTFDVRFDGKHQLYYVKHYGKKLYLSKKYSTKKQVEDYYKSILLEQDEKSPHRYFVKGFEVEDGDIVIDCGVAEGNFALEIVDKVSKIYLVEADQDWIEALQITFKDYEDKVVIINAFVSSYNEGDYRTLDSLIQEKVNFIKMDIEGNEWDGLRGAKRIIEDSERIKLAICSYHSDFDHVLIERYMNEMDIVYSYSDGYMWFPWLVRQNYVSTSLNRALVRGTKEK